MCEKTTAHNANKNANDCFPRRSSALRATRTMQSVWCSLFGHAILFNIVHTAGPTFGRGGGGKERAIENIF